MEVFDRIAQIRNEKNLSQYDMAERLNIGQSAYFQIEKGKTALTVSRLYQIAEILGVSVSVLLGEKIGDNASSDSEYIKTLEKKYEIMHSVLGIVTDDHNKMIDIHNEEDKTNKRLSALETKVNELISAQRELIDLVKKQMK